MTRQSTSARSRSSARRKPRRDAEGIAPYRNTPVGGGPFSFREKIAQKQRDKIADEVARGDEAAVNARIGRFRALGPWVVIALLIIGGCAVTRTCYVREQDKVTALRPGETYSNATEAVEWVVPRTVMTQLVIANEGLR